MKNIVKFKSIQPSGTLTIDIKNPEWYQSNLQEILDEYLPYSKIFEKITIKNFTVLSNELLSRLVNQYLHGAEIVFNTPNKGFSKSYLVKRPKPFYSYKWTELDLTAPVPRSLAEFTFNYKGTKTTYLDALKTLTSTKYLPNEIWNALDIYSKQQIDKCREYNKGNYNDAECWFKELMKDCAKSHIKMFSPNAKTYFEAMAELTFEKECEDARLKEGLRPLTNAEIAFLKQYAPAYGVEIPSFQWRYNTRKTKDGYTQEIERLLNGMSSSDYSRMTYDPRNSDNLPKNIRQQMNVNISENDKFLRDAYYQLRWIMKNLKDDGLMPGWRRCPECHEIYKEHEGCKCGHCAPVEFIQAENLLYGISATYEDYDSTHDAYNELDYDFDIEDLDI